MSRPIDDPSAEPAAEQPTSRPGTEQQPSAERPATPFAAPNPYAGPQTGPGAGTGAGPQAWPGAGPQAWPPYAAAAPQPKAKVSGMAVTSFVLGLIGFLPPLSLVSIGLAVGAFRRIFRRRQGGFGLAAAGLVLASTWTVILATVGSIVAYGIHDMTSGPTRGADGHPVAAGRAGAWYLKVGDCAADDLSTYKAEPNHYRIVPCGQPHRLEVFASAKIPGGSSYPGVASVEDSARQLCAARTDSADVPPGGSVGYFYPSQGRWWLFDDREALCVFTSRTPWSGPVKPNDSAKPGTPV